MPSERKTPPAMARMMRTDRGAVTGGFSKKSTSRLSLSMILSTIDDGIGSRKAHDDPLDRDLREHRRRDRRTHPRSAFDAERRLRRLRGRQDARRDVLGQPRDAPRGDRSPAADGA